jgi:hypothetical protein
LAHEQKERKSIGVIDRIQLEYALSVVSVRTGRTYTFRPGFIFLVYLASPVFHSLMPLLIFTYPALYTNHKIDLFCQRDYTDIETPIDNLGLR